MDKLNQELEKSKHELNVLTIDLQKHQDELSKLDNPDTHKLLHKKCGTLTPEETETVDLYYDITSFMSYFRRRIEEEKSNIAKLEAEIKSLT